MIEGGYILQPRAYKDSAIAHCPPHFREIWLWLLREANYADTKICKRGQLIRSYHDILEGLCWYVGWRKETYSKNNCEIAMRWLVKEGMIDTEKTTRGMLITIVNYDRYQDPTNYETYNERYKNNTRTIQSADTINKKEKKEKKRKEEKDAPEQLPNVLSEDVLRQPQAPISSISESLSSDMQSVAEPKLPATNDLMGSSLNPPDSTFLPVQPKGGEGAETEQKPKYKTEQELLEGCNYDAIETMVELQMMDKYMKEKTMDEFIGVEENRRKVGGIIKFYRDNINPSGIVNAKSPSYLKIAKKVFNRLSLVDFYKILNDQKVKLKTKKYTMEKFIDVLDVQYTSKFLR
jgi:hypothetical protein